MRYRVSAALTLAYSGSRPGNGTSEVAEAPWHNRPFLLGLLIQPTDLVGGCWGDVAPQRGPMVVHQAHELRCRAFGLDSRKKSQEWCRAKCFRPFPELAPPKHLPRACWRAPWDKKLCGYCTNPANATISEPPTPDEKENRLPGRKARRAVEAAFGGEAEAQSCGSKFGGADHDSGA